MHHAQPIYGRRRQRRPDDAPVEGADGRLAKAPRTMLGVLASRHPGATTRVQLATLSGYSIRSSTFRNALSALRVAGAIDENGHDLVASDTGLDLAGDAPPAPSTQGELLAYWKGKIGLRAGIMLEVLAASHPSPISREELAPRANTSLTSSTFRNALSKLRANRLAIVDGQNVKASDAMFELPP